MLHKSQYNVEMESLQHRIGEQIRLRRKELNITQPHLAEIAQVSVNTLYKIERGEANPTLEVLGKLLEVLGLELCVNVKSVK